MKIAPPARREQPSAFTLIELLTVIAIIAVLMGLLFPAVNAVKDSARKTQAKNDVVNIVNAVKWYYTEYGKYPVPAGTTTDYTYGGTAANSTNDNPLFNVLRVIPGLSGDQLALNPRQIVFLEVPTAKDTNNPKSGISANSATAGQFMDPWGTPYYVRMDSNYDNQLTNPYSTNAGFSPMSTGVIAWSFGKDKASTSTATASGGDKNAGTSADDVLSWQ